MVQCKNHCFMLLRIVMGVLKYGEPDYEIFKVLPNKFWWQLDI